MKPGVTTHSLAFTVLFAEIVIEIVLSKDVSGKLSKSLFCLVSLECALEACRDGCVGHVALRLSVPAGSSVLAVPETFIPVLSASKDFSCCG